MTSDLQHLTTFVLDRKDGMVTVDDGVRRLRLLEAKGKVWTQEMVLQVEEKSVSLLELDTQVACTCTCSQKVVALLRLTSGASLRPQSPLERFPVGSVQLCRAVMDSCVFHSLLALVCRDPGQSKPDLHLFQSDHVKVGRLWPAGPQHTSKP